MHQAVVPACTDRFRGTTGTLITRAQHSNGSASRAGHLWVDSHTLTRIRDFVQAEQASEAEDNAAEEAACDSDASLF